MTRLRTSVFALGILLAGLAAPLPAEQTPVASALQKSFIWSPSAPTGKQAYVVFRKTFRLDQASASAALHLFADSRYILWINGQYVDRGPCRFDPSGPEYDTLDVGRFLQAGENVVAVLVHHYHDGKPAANGDGWCGRIMRHAPGLTAILDITDSQGAQQSIPTDTTWRVSQENRFGPGAYTWTSIPDNIDARRDAGDWTMAAFDDAAWEKAVLIDGKQWGPLRARRIPLLRETEVKPLYLVQRQTGDAAPETLAEKLELTQVLPLELSAGQRVVLDAGRFVQAYCEIAMDADEGSVLEITCAQVFYASGNKPEGAWAGTSRYVARQGRQVYVSGDTFGYKYMVLHCAVGKVRVLGVKLVNRLYPFDLVGKFTCNDPLLNEIWQLGPRTVLTTSEDAYVDCATRERAEWLGDGVLIAYPLTRATMAGPGADGKPYWSDPRLFGNLLRHIGQSTQSDGHVKAHAPSDREGIHAYIEDYACLWIHGIRQWHDNTGDVELVRELWPAVTAQLKWFLDRRTERGLVKAREFVFVGNPLCYQVCEGAALNAYIVQALVDAAELAQVVGDSQRQREYADASQAIQKALNTELWDAAAGTYLGGIKDGVKTGPTAHAAAVCLFFNVMPAERRKSVEQYFLANIERESFQPYTYAILFEVLAHIDSAAADQVALDLIRKHWAPMTRFETQTTWESFGPGENCHECGGSPTTYLSRHVLGVDLDGPAAQHRLAIKPHLGDLKQAVGVVVTELGLVPIRWNRTDDAHLQFAVEIPAGATARVLLPPAAVGATVTVDGQAVATVAADAGRVAIELGAGKHSGECAGMTSQ